MKLLLILLLSFSVYATDVSDGWPKGADGGLELARTYCTREDAKASDAMVFEFEEDGKTILFHATCEELMWHLAALDRVDETA